MKKLLTVKKTGEKDVLFKQDVLEESIITVGNNPSATLELKNTAIAPEQFVIITENEQLLLMNRADGTVVNGESLGLGSKIELKEGDIIEVGNFELAINLDEVNDSNEFVQEELDLEDKRANTISAGVSMAEGNLETTPKDAKDFSAVLDNLKEEDSFYFHIIDKENIIERILFDSEEVWVGTSFAENAIKKDKSDLDEIFAQVKKDWSGAVIHPSGSEELYLNGELLKEPHRLKNEDELVLLDEFAEDEDVPPKITFHEPVVLLALNSILPEELPKPVSLQSVEKEEDTNVKQLSEGDLEDKEQLNQNQNNSPVKKKKRRAFGYFSFLELLIMAIGTLVTATIIFLVLEFV